ncbi:MAG: CDP-paratose 2-epimerase [Phycisphaerales bacterium]|nr:MAG: CDP-paratose 2-epimerase [Phycisphaerales bacterium]
MPRTYETECWLPTPIDEVFPFFADAWNLERITPPFLKFEVLTPKPLEMREGAIIDYRLRLKGFPIRWRTRIAAWEPPFRFIDTQIKGPYRLWHHEHTFEARDGGTLCRDVVTYSYMAQPLVESWWVRKDIEAIFAHRQKVMQELFGGASSGGDHQIRREAQGAASLPM